MTATINSLSSYAIPLLFGPSTTAEQNSNAPPDKLLEQATGYTDDHFKAGNAIGKIIEIVAGMNASVTSEQSHMFTMEGAERIVGLNGSYKLVKTGTGAATSDEELQRRGLEIAQRQAEGFGPLAEKAKAYVKAVKEGTIVVTDLAAYGVKSIQTETVFYYADGRERGGTGTFQTTGLKEFIANYTYADENGMMRDVATGKYASFNQNGTYFSYNVF